MPFAVRTPGPADRRFLSPGVVGDSGPWAEYPTVLWAALADSANDSFLVPPGDGEDVQQHIRYWTPLLALTMGALGWVRPDLGIARWLEIGMPQDGAALRLMHRWWGWRVEGIVAWGQGESLLSALCGGVDAAVGLANQPDLSLLGRAPRALRGSYPRLTQGGTDPLHLSHVQWHLTGTVAGPGTLLHVTPSDERHVILLLDGYDGWYRRLHEMGIELPVRPDGRSWKIKVVVKSIGSLGIYRRSLATGRWFTGRHRWHLLGSPAHQ